WMSRTRTYRMTGIGRYCQLTLMVLALFICSTNVLQAQQIDRLQDTRPDTTACQRGGGQQGLAPTPQEEGRVNFQSTDSLIFVFDTTRTGTLYGSASVAHQSGQLKAGKISLNIDRNIVSAYTQTPEDTLSKPVLIRDQDEVRSNRIDFNYKTEKGRFEVARVNIADGKVTGTRVKKTAPHVVFLEDAIYSTCTLDHPHYYIKADRMKVVDEEKVFFQRARLYILDIPYPIVFPFG